MAVEWVWSQEPAHLNGFITSPQKSGLSILDSCESPFHAFHFPASPLTPTSKPVRISSSCRPIEPTLPKQPTACLMDCLTYQNPPELRLTPGPAGPPACSRGRRPPGTRARPPTPQCAPARRRWRERSRGRWRRGRRRRSRRRPRSCRCAQTSCSRSPP
jgi:hypothetical protein